MIDFRAEEEFFTFHDPMQDGKLIDRKTEVRFDPLTGASSRIIFDPGAPFVPADFSMEAEQTAGAKCPFCPENIFTSTPRFPDELVEGGRFIHGEAVVFPNLFPYSKHNAVVRMTEQHYVTLPEFTAQTISEAFRAAHQYLAEVAELNPQTAYASINWNYLPPSGGSILHPHLHALASEHPTNYQAIVSTACGAYYGSNGADYFTELAEQERERGDRWIASAGSIDWLHAFAPLSHMDFLGVFKASSLAELTDDDYDHLAASLVRLFAFLKENGISSFNAALFIPLTRGEGQRVHFRLVPRMTIGMLGTSDMNVFNFMHAEPLSLKAPESVALRARRHF